MNLILYSLMILAAGTLSSLLLVRRPRASLIAALLAIVAGGTLTVCGSLQTLLTLVIAHTLIWDLPLGHASLGFDPLSAFFLLAIGILSVAAAVYSYSYMMHELAEGHALGFFPALLCLLLASMTLVVTARDVMLFLVAWELMSLASFLLIMFHDRDPVVRRGAWMYLIATHIGTAFFLLPMFALLVSLGGWDFGTIAAATAALGPPHGALPMVLFGLGLIGFGTKAGFMPMHVWLPNAHPVAPTPVSALLSAVVIKVGIYGILRLLTFLGPLPPICGTLLLALGFVTGVMGVLYALAHQPIKRLLAYSSVENIGIIGIAMGVGMLGQATGHPAIAVLGYAGVLLHVLNHSLFKGLLFLSAGAIIQATGTGDIDRLGGVGKKTPGNAMLFLVAILAICGLPPLNGFVSEFFIYAGLFHGATVFPAAAAGAAVVGLMGLALMGGLALATFTKVYATVFLGEPREASITAHKTPRTMLLGMAIPAVLCLGIGLAPAYVLRLLPAAVGALTPVSKADFSEAASPVLAPVVMVSRLTFVLLGIVAVLLVLRRGAGARQVTIVAASRRVPTWGCGYAAPTARMQYTASSFGWSLLRSFRQLLRTQRSVCPPVGCFPGSGTLVTTTPDFALAKVYTPTFDFAGRVAQSVRPMERGRIQLFLMYIVITLVLVFAIDTLFRPSWPSGSQTPAPAHASIPTPLADPALIMGGHP